MDRTDPESLPPSSPRARRFDVSAPEQNAGAAPVTTIAPVSSSASAASTAATISSTIAALNALRRSGSSRVKTRTRSRCSTWRVMSLAVADHGGGVAEEVLDVALVAVLGLTDRRLKTQAPGERVDRADRRVAVLVAGLRERGGVHASPVAQQPQDLGWDLDEAEQSERLRGEASQHRRHR